MEPNYTVEQSFEKINFTKDPLAKGEYECCTFVNCNFEEADISEITFIETEFIDCNFSNANITNTSFQDVVFKNCKMLGLQFEKCNGFGFTASFDLCQLDHSSFYQLKLNRSSFQNSQLQGVDFTEAELKSIVVQYCDLLNATFENTNMEKADLRNSFNYSINPESNRIKEARFSLPDVIGLLDKYKIRIEKEI